MGTAANQSSCCLLLILRTSGCLCWFCNKVLILVLFTSRLLMIFVGVAAAVVTLFFELVMLMRKVVCQVRVYDECLLVFKVSVLWLWSKFHGHETCVLRWHLLLLQMLVWIVVVYLRYLLHRHVVVLMLFWRWIEVVGLHRWGWVEHRWLLLAHLHWEHPGLLERPAHSLHLHLHLGM